MVSGELLCPETGCRVFSIAEGKARMVAEEGEEEAEAEREAERRERERDRREVERIERERREREASRAASRNSNSEHEQDGSRSGKEKGLFHCIKPLIVESIQMTDRLSFFF